MNFPWPPGEDASTIDSLVETWRESTFHPASFFRAMPREGNYGSVILYYIIVSVVGAGLSLFWHTVLPAPSLGPFADILPKQSPRSEVVSFLFSPVIALIVLFVIAGIAHLMLLLVGAAKHGFDTTTRVVAFTHGPALFVIVPYLGMMIAGIWTLVLAVIGFREAHETSTGRAAAAVFIPFVLVIGLALLMTIAITSLGLLKIPI